MKAFCLPKTIPTKSLLLTKVISDTRQRRELFLLRRRRNSCHLKMLQYTKDLAPNSAHRNKENHSYVAAMEKRLKEMQGALAIIDREFGEEEAAKQVISR